MSDPVPLCRRTQSTIIKRDNGLDGRLLYCEIELSNWLLNAIEHNEVLTLSKTYFRLRKPIERRLYEIARKHCGSQEQWAVSLPILLKKTGSQSPERRFRQSVRELTRGNHLPEYEIFLDEATDTVIFSNREKLNKKENCKKYDQVFLDPAVYDQARKEAPGADVHALEHEWKYWLMNNEIIPTYPERHFLKFCRTWYEREKSLGF